jgi:hypothetical protein
MPWAKVDDQWFAHRKVVGLSLAARGLWTTVLSWSCAQRTDHVPRHMVVFLAGGDPEVMGLAADLVDSGLWKANGIDGWVIHDWAEYQAKTLSEKRSEAGAKGGKASGEARREANGKQTEVASEADDEAGTRPGPSRPDPSQTSSSRTRSDRATRLPDGWTPNPEPELEKQAGGPKVVARELAKFRDHWAAAGGQRGRKVDWQATWRNWLRNTLDRGRPPPVEQKRSSGPVFGSPEWQRKQAEARARAEQAAGVAS